MKTFKEITAEIKELNGQTGKLINLRYRPQKINIRKGLTSFSTIEKSDLYRDITKNKANWSITANTNSLEMRIPHSKGHEADREAWMGLVKDAIPGKAGNLIRGGGLTRTEVQELKRDYEKAAKAFGADKVVSQDHSIYVMTKKPGKLKVEKGLMAMLKALDEFGMRNHVSLSGRDGVLTQIQDAGQYNESVSVNEFRRYIVKTPRGDVRVTANSPNDAITRARSKFSASTPVSAFSARQESVEESIQLQEGMSKQMPIEKYAKKIGINKKEQQWILDNEADMIVYEPNQNKANSFLVLSYPVNDGDYYFAFLTSTRSGVDAVKAAAFASKHNAQMNKMLKQLVAKNKKHIGDPNLAGFIYNEMGKKFEKLPRQLGAGDTMTREELAYAIEDITQAEIMWEGTLTPNKPQIAEGILDTIISKIRNAGKKIRRKMGRRGKTNMESVQEYNDPTKNFPRDREWRKLVRKHKRHIKALQDRGKDLPSDAEEDFVSWGMQNGEISNSDDIERFIDDELLNASYVPEGEMNLKELRRKNSIISEKYRSKFKADDVAKAVKIAHSMGGNMTGAYKKIEKMKRGLGDDPMVAAALRVANESVVQEGTLKVQAWTGSLKNPPKGLTIVKHQSSSYGGNDVIFKGDDEVLIRYAKRSLDADGDTLSDVQRSINIG